jgi:chromosome segregation ATPase
MAAKTHSSNSRGSATTARGKKNTRSTANSSSRSNTGSRANSRGKKNTSSRARTSGSQIPATPAGKSLDRAQHALDQATKTEKQLRTSLKKHTKQVRAVQADLSQRDHDLKTMKSQLKAAKKSRKQAAKAVQI